jgi:hypothetical protein
MSVTYDRLVVSLVTLLSSTNKSDCHDITEILLKVVLNTINQPTTYLVPATLQATIIP